MSILTFATPIQSALPVMRTFAGSMAGAARPLFGLGVLVTLVMVFKPLAAGILRAGLMLVTPRQTTEQRMRRAHLRDMLLLNRMARDLDQSQPNLAAEFRGFASR
jgi:hypothetical protein